MSKHRSIAALWLAAIFILLGIGSVAAQSQSRRPIYPPGRTLETLNGTISVIWGDPQPGQPGGSQTRTFLTDDHGRTVELSLDEKTLREAGGILALNGRRVSVSTATPHRQAVEKELTAVDASSITPLVSTNAAGSYKAVEGSQPFISIMCKFNDSDETPQERPYFEAMFGDAAPGLSHYWKEQSYGQINLNGSNAHGWYQLPKSRSEYYYSADRMNLSDLFDDCTGAAAEEVNFIEFKGINLMFNENLDGYAWGGTIFKNLDGRSAFWRTTWDPPWAYQNIAVMAHEVGHAMGLPHSSGQYGRVYDNQWDVMSDTWSNCLRTFDPSFGCLGQHTISYHKEMLGWLDGRVTAAAGRSQTVILERLANPQSSNPLMVKIPLDNVGDRFYTVEARQWSGYDAKLPRSGMLIHEVNLLRSIPAQVIDSDLNGNTGDEGAQWLPGETFYGDAGITVTVDSAGATGYTITITRPAVAEKPAAQPFYLSTKRAGKMDGLSFRAADILRYDSQNGLSMFFDASDVGIKKNLSAFSFTEDGSILLALSDAQRVSGLGKVKPQDVLRFTPDSLGENTSGTLEWHLRGADGYLTTNGEKVDALSGSTAACRAPSEEADLLLSTSGRATVYDAAGEKFKAQDEDIINGRSAWHNYLDGSNIDGLAREDINGLWLDPANCDLYITISSGFRIGAAKGNGKDIVRLAASGEQNNRSYEPSLFWDGSMVKFPRNLDGIEFPTAAFP